MIRTFSAMAASVALAGCVVAIGGGDDSRPEPPAGADTCQAAKYATLVGKSAAELQRMSLPTPHRIVCHDCMVTQDYAPNRLNIRLGPDNRVVSVDCG